MIYKINPSKKNEAELMIISSMDKVDSSILKSVKVSNFLTLTNNFPILSNYIS